MSASVLELAIPHARTATQLAVSIVVPTLNEAANLAPLYGRIESALQAAGYPDFEILFVDDGSSDGTPDRARLLAEQTHGRVRLLQRRGQRSLSGSVIDGWAAAHSDVLVVIDADLQHPPEVVPRLLNAIDDGADLVVASRYVPGGESQLKPLRNLLSQCSTALVRLALGRRFRISDPLSGCFALRRRVIDGATLSASGFKILMEVLACGIYEDVRELPFRFVERTRGDSKLGIGTALRDLRGMMRAAREFRRRRAAR